jgi:hypothetical protein
MCGGAAYFVDLSFEFERLWWLGGSDCLGIGPWTGMGSAQHTRDDMLSILLSSIYYEYNSMFKCCLRKN